MKETIERLKEKGVTLTPQRLAVIEFLMKNKNHPCVDEIYNVIKKKYPSISPATVYSTLQLLKEMGEIQELHIRGDKACFDPVAERHHHLLCRVCGKTIDVKVQCPLIDNLKIAGHQVEDVQAYLYGVCVECLKKKEKKEKKQKKKEVKK
ncbi:MAG: transcriptional repressor [Candidatus Cloacimonadota bacterium]|jgi:Fur family peroxide stress response transcriptional regulator|nr:MAG: transcriptional repressor [Candidatus Cloacimonadota bacterium]